MIDILIKSQLFKGINQEELIKTLNTVFHQVRSYKKDEIIAHSGDPCDRLMIVIKGVVRGEMIDFNGKTIKIEDIEAPRPVAIAFLFGHQNRFPVTITSNMETKILIFPKDSVIKLIMTDRQFLENYLNAISGRTQFLSGKIKFLSFKTIRGKIAHYLLHLAGNDLRIVTIPSSHKQMAEMFGVTRQGLSRVLHEMENDGLIKIDKRNIILENKSGLNELLQQG
ncbi:MAG: Crp/Fnr family transcriptional regulator [Bacteroidota bacterium]